MIFSQYGKVVEIVCSRGIKLRGQAWVTFTDVASATSAMRGKQGFNFYDKPIHLAYAKQISTKAVRAGKINPPAVTGTATAGTAAGKRKRGDDSSVAGNGDAEDGNNSDGGDAHKGPHPTLAHANVLEVNNEPHHVLFAQNLPSACSEEMLAVLFSQCQGYKELRIPPGNKGIAFIEFENEVQASLALKQLHGHALTATDQLFLTYSKKG